MRSSGSLQHRTQVCTGDHAGIAAEPAGLDVGLGRNVLCLALGQYLVADLQRDQVSCCTVYITLNEVETLTPTSTSFGAKLLAALRNGWTGFVSGAQAVAVFLVGAWPAILIGAVCGVIYYRVRHPRKKK